MDKFITLQGIAAPLPIVNIDTDMIIPKQFLKTIKRTGLGKSLFFEMRYDDDGQPLKDEHLNLLGADKIVTSYFDANPHYLKSATGGAGGSDSSGGSSKQSLEAFTKEMMDAGHSPNSEGFNQIMTERIKSGTLDL